jgi:anion-transporting  ArsA/GET3 family ATPase
VITIDPAKRLATSLGLDSLKNEPTDITHLINQSLLAEGKTPLTGKVSAIMPETEKTFERFIENVAGENKGIAKKILQTSIYKIFAQEFSGMNEYLAIEKLYDLYQSKEYDLIILDTPPSANTLMFLNAPMRLMEFFDDRIVKLFINPGNKIFAFGIRKVLEVLEKITGKGFISEFLDFTANLFELRGRFMDNLNDVQKLLHQDDVSFVMVTSSERISKPDTQCFVEKLKNENYPFWGFIVNRSVAKSIHLPLNQIATFQPDNSESVPNGLITNFNKLKPRLIHEKDTFEWLKTLKKEIEVIVLPENPVDIHSVDALTKLMLEV